MIVWPYGGQREILTTLIGAQVFRANLYQNDRVPRVGDTVGDYTVATFSGYTGFKLLTGWSGVVISGDRAITHSASVTWTHSGGPTDNNIYGVFVTTPGGLLLFAERYAAAPFFISPATPNFSYSATLADLSEYTGPP